MKMSDHEMPTDINVIKTRLCSGGKEGKSKNEEGFSGVTKIKR